MRHACAGDVGDAAYGAGQPPVVELQGPGQVGPGQAIEKASAKLLRVLGHAFPDDDYRQFAQLGSDNLDNTIEEAPDEVVIIIVEPPSLARDLA